MLPLARELRFITGMYRVAVLFKVPHCELDERTLVFTLQTRCGGSDTNWQLFIDEESFQHSASVIIVIVITRN